MTLKDRLLVYGWLLSPVLAACAAFIPVHVVVPNTHTGMWIEFSPEPNRPGPPCPVGRICI